MRKKRNKELLNEEIKKFKLISEYSFYEDREEEENLILGMNEEDEEPSDEEAPEVDLGFGDEEAPEGEDKEELDIEDKEPSDEEEPEADLGFGDEEAPEDELDMEEPAGDEVELDVTELVKGSEEAKASADAANAKIDQLMQMVSKLENATKGMDAISNKIENLETEFEKRNPTEEEKLEMRSLSSAPYNLKLTDFWKDKEGVYDVMGDENKEPKEYVLTKDDVDSDYSEVDMKTSLDDNDYIEDEI